MRPQCARGGRAGDDWCHVALKFACLARRPALRVPSHIHHDRQTVVSRSESAVRTEAVSRKIYHDNRLGKFPSCPPFEFLFLRLRCTL